MIFCIKQFRSSEIWAVCSKSSVQKITSNFQVIRIFGVLIFEILLYWIRFICLQKYLNACAVVTHHVFSKINVTHTNTNKRKTNFVRTSRIRYANNSCAAKINESNFDIDDFLLPEVYISILAEWHAHMACALNICPYACVYWRYEKANVLHTHCTQYYSSAGSYCQNSNTMIQFDWIVHRIFSQKVI